jgi:DNA-directed RNA polymerase II subunit RPB2
MTQNNEPEVNDSKTPQEEFYYGFKGKVYCLEIPNTHQHVYYSRESNVLPAVWSGNSSRAGQKGTCGVLLDEADMPRTREGIAPAIIMNPHCIPSRMTIGQLIEALVACLGAERCAQIDATFFKKVDIESIALLLEQLGLDKYGKHRLYNGMTGEYIDCMIFMNPTYIQRLQKFCIDSLYGVSSGPSDAITRQPLDGKGSNGGLRIGEMERDVIVSHSAMKFMTEKFFSHSDGFTHHVCRCGKAATVNVAKGIYKCNYCKDNADIVAYNTSWSSKLFIQELESMNVGIRQKPDPFTYDTVDQEVEKILG